MCQHDRFSNMCSVGPQKKILSIRITGRWKDSIGTSGFSSRKVRNKENVFMPWRYHAGDVQRSVACDTDPNFDLQ